MTRVQGFRLHQTDAGRVRSPAEKWRARARVDDAVSSPASTCTSPAARRWRATARVDELSQPVHRRAFRFSTGFSSSYRRHLADLQPTLAEPISSCWTGKDGAVNGKAPASRHPARRTRVELSGDAALRLVALKAAHEAPADPDRNARPSARQAQCREGWQRQRPALADAMIDDLHGLLQSEVSLELALKTMKVPASLAPEDRAAIRGQVEATRQALLRCRRLGNALLDVVRRTRKRKAAQYHPHTAVLTRPRLHTVHGASTRHLVRTQRRASLDKLDYGSAFRSQAQQ